MDTHFLYLSTKDKQAKVTIFYKKNEKPLPLKTLSCEWDLDTILDTVEGFLTTRNPDWQSEKEKYSLHIIPPEKSE